MTRLLLATRNKHKILEIQTMMAELGIQILTLDDVPGIPPLREDGDTFAANSLQKARAVFDAAHMPTLADDSGLEVFYLNGRPGVYSARYAGANATDDENNEKVLAELRGVPPRRRRARFHAVVTIVSATGVLVAEGICPGRLGEVPIGTNGFGYDPLFIPDGFRRTYAQLTAEEKNTISHRSKALASMKKLLRNAPTA